MSAERNPSDASSVPLLPSDLPTDLRQDIARTQQGPQWMRWGALCLILMFAASVPLVSLLAATPPAKSDAVAALEKQLLDVSKRGYRTARNLHASGKLDVPAVVDWSNRLLNAELANATTDEQRIDANQAHVARTGEIEMAIRTKFDAGVAGAEQLYYAQHAHLDAKLSLERLNSKPAK